MVNNNLIKIKLIEKDITMKDLAPVLNVNCNTLSRWANGNNLNQIEKFLKLLDYLNIELNDILV